MFTIVLILKCLDIVCGYLTCTFTDNAKLWHYSTLYDAVLNGGSVEDGLVFILDHPD